jgi:hypothetical protein
MSMTCYCLEKKSMRGYFVIYTVLNACMLPVCVLNNEIGMLPCVFCFCYKWQHSCVIGC